MEKQEFTNIMVEIKGKLININDLPAEQYEKFLELMNQLRMVYIAIQSSRK